MDNLRLARACPLTRLFERWPAHLIHYFRLKIRNVCLQCGSVGRNGLDGARKKGDIRVRAMMDAFSGVTGFVRMTAARGHDRKFLYHPDLPANSRLVFDKAYDARRQFAKGSKQKIWFVARRNIRGSLKTQKNV